MTSVLIKKELGRGEDLDTDKERRRPREDGGRAWADVATSQGLPGANKC